MYLRREGRKRGGRKGGREVREEGWEKVPVLISVQGTEVSVCFCGVLNISDYKADYHIGGPN